MQIQNDKVGHFIAGVIIAIVVTLVTGNAQWGLVASIVAGIGKEAVWDGLMGRGTVEVLDAVATIAGGGIVCYALQTFVL